LQREGREVLAAQLAHTVLPNGPLRKSIIRQCQLGKGVLSLYTARMLEPVVSYRLGIIDRVLQEERIQTPDGATQLQQILAVKDTQSGKTVEVEVSQPQSSQTRWSEQQRVVLVEQKFENEVSYAISDAYRLPVLGGLGLFFFLLVAVLVKKQGLFAFLGMMLSFAVLLGYLIPQLLAGANPVTTSLFAAVMISAASMYLSHGWSVRSHLSFVSILSALTLASGLSLLVTILGHFTGFGSEEAMFLQMGATASINVQGLFLGGILLGTLSILDDIAVSQVSIVFQLKHAQARLSARELYARALSIGKDHVASLVNTLVLAYAGASLPLFLLFSTANTTPLWVTLNSEMIAEEVVRTLVGSIALVLTVPISTGLAVMAARKGVLPPDEHQKPHHHHHHD